ncbi:coproporphyrinogen III oxidase [Calditerricola satsumensis]|uniref:Coproporphyrinogen III oxidase n=3 Tax=Calditerricola satsumensis TaxID=373054 RepID=A0A8J3B9P0_9BACI|nr:coproporphyrinogen III oxidase [Calditerricola satsumensis]GGK05836.1 coproporphyrinogen III oxidase [Calditerricola satsumensis]
MRLFVECAEPYARELELIAKLFFDDLAFLRDATDGASWRARVTVEEGDGDEPVRAKAELRTPERTYRAEHARPVRFVGEARARQKAAKKAAAYVFLDVLEQATGVRQPWGVLTGVRPTKLYHQFVQAGHTPEEIAAILESEYRLTPEKVDLLARIVARQRTVLPDLYELDGEVSLYIGIPFCPTKCAYCTFPAYDIRGQQGSVDDFLRALLDEIAQVGAWLRERNLPVTSIYVGGGTPTSLTAEQLDTLLDALRAHVPHVDRVREWTVEAGRPDTITPEKIAVLKKHGVGRISVNPQSFTQATLEAIGRHHTVGETIEAFHLARRMGVDNINMDLIIGLPGEGTGHLRHSLDMVGRLQPDSLTIHTLAFKRASAMTQNREAYRVASREEIHRMMALAASWTAAHGYHPYYLYRQKNILGNLENVGYAKDGKESVYNIIIMEERHTIIGLGCGAVSKIILPGTDRVIRFANPKEPKAYIAHSRDTLAKKLALLDEAYGAKAATASA